jgi:hypothetical protein
MLEHGYRQEHHAADFGGSFEMSRTPDYSQVLPLHLGSVVCDALLQGLKAFEYRYRRTWPSNE